MRRFVLRAALADEPDRVSSPSIFGPRVVIGLASLPRTGLLAPGAIAEHALRAVLPPGADVAGDHRRAARGVSRTPAGASAMRARRRPG